MKVIRRTFEGVSRPDTWRLYPLGDVHIGNRACNEAAFRAAVKRIAEDDRALWLGLGDYCDFVGRVDYRFDVGSLAEWIRVPDLADLNRAQVERFLDIVEPIAGKCLGLIEGNHERHIYKKFERNVYSEIVNGVKKAAGLAESDPLAFGYSGWLILSFRRGEGTSGVTSLRVYLHHGFVGGKLAGAKALNMQRVLWTHDCHLAIMGHSHNTAAQVEAVNRVRGSRVVQDIRQGCYGGTFMNGARYAEEKGYFPLPLTQPMIELRPGANLAQDRIRIRM